MSYWLFILPILAAIIAQLIKALIELGQGKFSWHQLINYGGMPSSHAAIVFAVLTEAAVVDGFDSITFAIAIVITILTVRDATGFRRDLGRHAEVINRLESEASDIDQPKLRHLETKVGHTPLQIFFGALVGILIILIANQFILL